MAEHETTGILLVNLGSPDSPRPNDVRRYLGEFLMDERVIDVPYAIRRFIVSCMILPFRPRRSARAYRSIWWDEGSPLIAISRKLRALLAEQIAEPVEIGMRYGNPSTERGIRNLLERSSRRIRRIRIIPMYPHYAMSSYETAVEAVRAAAARVDPSLRLDFVAPFFDDMGYIEALVESARATLDAGYGHLLFSYHGIPERHVRKTDPTSGHCLGTEKCCESPSAAHTTCYRHQVLRTTELFVRRAGIEKERYSVAFQSRLGRDRWLTPATAAEMVRLARSGVKHLVVMCPAFVTDCLETLEEIGIAGRRSFLEAGGERFDLIPCLNDHPAWVRTLAGWCRSEGVRLLPAKHAA